ncbi:MAG TPA: FtsX-like permease family protein, partial [Anaerolineae bacterium]|nr:FtsX-like permease family protein [Anaerolineae bacterium]
MTFINPLLSILELVWERAHSRLGQRAALALGVLLASTAICATLLYADGISIAGLRDRLSQEHNQATYDVLIKGAANIIDRGKYDEINDFIFSQAERTIGLPISRSGRHGWSKSLLVIPPGVDPAGKRSNLPTTRFQFYAGIEDQVEVIEGHFPHPAHDPQDTVEVMVTEKLAQELGLHPGDRFRVEDWTGSDQPMHVTVELAAIIRLRDPESNFWFYAPWFLDQAFTVPEETFFNAIALAFVPTEGEFTWVANFDEAAINPENAGRVLAGLDLFRFRLQEQLQKARLLTDLDDILKEYQRSSFILKALLILLGAPIVGIALYYIVMSSTMIVEGQKDEIAILKSRGASDGQLLGLFVAEGLIIGLAAVLLAPLLAIPLGRFIGRTTTFMVFDNPRSIPVFLRSSTFSYAGGAALLALLATLQPVLGAARETIVTYKQEAARPRKRSLVHRTYFDVVLMGLAALGYRLLTQRGTIVSRGPTGGLEFDPLLLVTPIVLVLGVALFALRLMPLLMRALACLWALTDSVSVLIALRGIARTHGYYPSLVLLLTFTLSVGLFTASVAGTFDANYSDQALYQTGADLRTAVFDFEDMRWETLPLSDYEAIPGVKTAMPALRYELIGREATVRVKGRLVAIDPDRFPQTAFWRHDFAEVPLDTLMATLKTQPEGLLVNPSFARKHRLNLGQRFDINIDGVRVDFVLSGYV